MKWINGDLLLTTQVTPDTICGPDSGHMEAYCVSVPDGIIKEHLTVAQLKQYPGVSLENSPNQ